MTKEEVLEQLKEISILMAGDEVIEANENNRKLNELTDQKEILEKQILDLEVKLNDDSNYPSFNFMKNKSNLDKIKRSIERLNLIQERNETNILSDTTRIKEIDGDIEACNELISQYEQYIDEIGKKLRALGDNPDKKIEENLSNDLKSKREQLDYLRGELAVYTAERENLVNSINSMTERNKGIPSSMEKYEELEKTISEKDKKDAQNPVDNDKKEKDAARLAELKANLEAINVGIDFERFTPREEVNMLIAEIETGSIEEKEIINKVEEIKSKLPQSLMETDYEEYESKLEENRQAQADILMEVVKLQDRLGDNTNYSSPMAIEVIHEEISNAELKIAKHDEDIKFSEYLISEYQMEISENESSIIEYENKIEELQAKNDEIRFMITDASLSSKEIDGLNKQITRNKKEIENYRKQIDRISKNSSTLETAISNTKKNKKEKENMKISDNKSLASLKEKLEDGKVVDMVEYLKDKEKLAGLNAQLAALKMQEEILNFPYYEKLDSIINGFKPKSKKMEKVIKHLKPKAEKLPIIINKWKDASTDLIEKVKDSKFIKDLKKNIVKIAIVAGVAFATFNVVKDSNDKPKQTIEYEDPTLSDDEETPEVTPDMEVEETPEVAPDVKVEETPEVAPDVEVEETLEVTPNVEVEETPEAAPDVEVEETPEVAPDVEAEETPEAAPDVVVGETSQIQDVTLKQGETLIVESNDGQTVVDNSNMENSSVISQQYDDVNYDYPESQEIGDVNWNQNGSVDITLTTPITTEQTAENSQYNSNISAEEQAFLDAFLEEQREALEQGRSR